MQKIRGGNESGFGLGVKPSGLSIAAWAVFLALVGLSAYGFWSGRLFDQYVWLPSGLQRLVWFIVAYLAAVAVVADVSRRWLGPVLIAIAVLFAASSGGAPAIPAAAFLMLSAWAFGRIVLRFGPGPKSAIDELLALAAGLAGYMWLLSLAVHFRVNYAAVYAIAFAAPIALKARAAAALLRRMGRAVAPPKPGSVPEYGAISLAGFVFLAHWVIIWKPEISSDGLAMHMAVPAWIAQHHYWHFDASYLVWSVMPMGADWLYSAAYLLGCEFAARLLNFAALVILSAMVYFAARQWLSRTLAWLMIALFASTPLVQLVTGSLFVENIWAALLLGSVLALWRFRETASASYLYACCILLGAGLATKFGSLAFAAPAGVAIALEIRRRARAGMRLRRTILIATALFVTFACVPYVTAYVKTGNPIFPFANAVFKSPYFDSGTSFVDNRFKAPLRAPELYDLTFHTSRFMESQDGAFGFQYLLFLPLAILFFLRKREWLPTASLLIAVPFSILTLLVQNYARYLYPALPLFSIAIAFGVAQIRERGRALFAASVAALIAVAGLNIYFLPASNWYHKDFYLNPFAPEERNAYGDSGARRLVAYLNEKHPGAPVAFFGSNDIAGLRGKAFADAWHNPSFSNAVRKAESSIDVLRMMNSLGIQYVIAPSGVGGETVSLIPVQMFLSEFTFPEFRFGRLYVAAIKPEYRGSQGVERAMAAQNGLLPSPAGSYDDGSSKVRYSGQWLRGEFPAAANRTVTYSKQPGASVSLLFNGAEVTYTFTKAFNRGIAGIYIDGKLSRKLDLYSPEIAWQSSITIGKLAPGDHTISVRVTGDKNARSSDAYVDLDQFVVK